MTSVGGIVEGTHNHHHLSASYQVHGSVAKELTGLLTLYNRELYLNLLVGMETHCCHFHPSAPSLIVSLWAETFSVYCSIGTLIPRFVNQQILIGVACGLHISYLVTALHVALYICWVLLYLSTFLQEMNKCGISKLLMLFNISYPSRPIYYRPRQWETVFWILYIL